MSDNSRLFAKIENRSLSKSLINKFPTKNSIEIQPGFQNKYKWADFRYKKEKFTIFSGTGDLLLFADNQKCSDKILKEVLHFLD